jgi:hypothetical protein
METPVKKRLGPIPRTALLQKEAAESLGVGVDFFRGHIGPQLRVVRVGSIRLYPLREIERWLDENAALSLDGEL